MTIKTLDSYKIEKSGKENKIFAEIEKKEMNEDSVYFAISMGNNYNEFTVVNDEVYILRDLLNKIIEYYEEDSGEIK